MQVPLYVNLPVSNREPAINVSRILKTWENNRTRALVGKKKSCVDMSNIIIDIISTMSITCHQMDFARVKRLLCGVSWCPDAVHDVFRYLDSWQSHLLSLAPGVRSQSRSAFVTNQIKQHFQHGFVGYRTPVPRDLINIILVQFLTMLAQLVSAFNEGVTRQ